MLKELEDQINDIHAGSTAKLDPNKEVSRDYGHAIGMIAQAGQLESLKGGDEARQIEIMRQRAEEQVIIFGKKILEFLRPELRALIEPERLDQLEEDHQIYLQLKSTR